MLDALNTSASTVVATKSSSKDLVTATDKACQDDIEAVVKDAFGEPGSGGRGHHFLGEESVAAGSEASASALAGVLRSEWLWVVDPIDGTTNFVHGVPLSVVSIGVAYEGEMAVGVIYDPFRDELFAASRGAGATLNGDAMHVSTAEAELAEACLMFGTHTTTRVSGPMLDSVRSLVGDVRAVRSLGSACLHLAWTAAGRCTGFWELDLNVWDLAAGALLVAEAGGRVTDTRGAPYSLSTRDILATNGAEAVHNGIVARLVDSSWDAPRAE